MRGPIAITNLTRGVNQMTKIKLFAAQYANPTMLRVAVVLLAILAMALAAGAPDAMGGGGH